MTGSAKQSIERQSKNGLLRRYAPRNDGSNPVTSSHRRIRAGDFSMAIKLFELVGIDEARPFSPYCWRTRMALAHKGLSAQSIPWRFTEKDAIAPHNSEKVPVLIDGETAIVDSWAIANYLEDTYPDRPSLFGEAAARSAARFINSWADLVQIGGTATLIAADIVRHLDPRDQEYFRQSRAQRF